eukprot:613252_1
MTVDRISSMPVSPPSSKRIKIAGSERRSCSNGIIASTTNGRSTLIDCTLFSGLANSICEYITECLSLKELLALLAVNKLFHDFVRKATAVIRLPYSELPDLTSERRAIFRSLTITFSQYRHLCVEYSSAKPPGMEELNYIIRTFSRVKALTVKSPFGETPVFTHVLDSPDKFSVDIGIFKIQNLIEVSNKCPDLELLDVNLQVDMIWYNALPKFLKYFAERCTKLKTLKLHQTGQAFALIDAFLENLPKTSQLETLILHRARVSESALSSLIKSSSAHLQDLEASLVMCPEVIECLSRCPRLRLLHCELTRPNSHLSDMHLINLGTSCSMLEEVTLNMSGTEWTCGGMCTFIRLLPDLKVLRLLSDRVANVTNGRNTGKSPVEFSLNDKFLEDLSTCTKLISLCLDVDSSFTVPVMTKFVSKCRQVIHFSMKGITDPLLTVVAQSCPHLRTLIIPENNSVGPKSILSVVEHCADSLETLSLECVKIGDVFVNDIVENCKRIRTLA